MKDIIKATEYSTDDLVESVAGRVAGEQKREIRREVVEDIADQSDRLAVRGRALRITVETTEELKELQANLDISEDRVRQMQADMGLSRLHPSRRQDFVADILRERVDERVAERTGNIDAEAREEAEAMIGELVAREGREVTLTWGHRDAGSFTQAVPDEDITLTVTIPNATTDYSNIPDIIRKPDVVIVEDDTEVIVDSPLGTETLTLDRGGWSFSTRSYRAIAMDSGLIEVERREASCTSSDKDALDIEVGRGDTDEKAHVIELQNSDGGYSSRYTKGWTEYRDIDPEREMVLITVGQASYYRNSPRGKSERTWLVGRDDGQVWAQQVYNTHTTVDEAMEFLTPAEVQRKRAEGRDVIRQGDVFFVEMKRSSNFEDIEDTRHEVEETDDGVVVNHPEHEDLDLDGKWKAITNNDGSKPSTSTRSRQDVARD